jgi:hypothetical protein
VTLSRSTLCGLRASYVEFKAVHCSHKTFKILIRTNGETKTDSEALRDCRDHYLLNQNIFDWGFEVQPKELMSGNNETNRIVL